MLHLLPPAGFAAAYVLISFAATPTPITGLFRPIAIAVLVAIVLAALFAAVFRSFQLGGLTASALVVLASAQWLPLIVVATGAGWLGLIALLRRWRGRSVRGLFTLTSLTRVMAIFAVFLAVVSLVAAMPQLADSFALNVDRSHGEPRADSPDIVFILLDAYPRPDVLADGFGVDDGSFESRLTDLGFAVKSQARSNYSATWPTIASMLNGTYLQELPGAEPFPTDQTEQYQLLSRLIDTSALPSVLRDHGYEIVWVEGPFEDVALNTADRVLTGGQVTAFELSLLQHSPLLPVLTSVAPDFLLSQHRDRIEHALELVPQLASASGRPTFSFVHVVSPHPPVVFQADGELAAPAACLPECSLWALVDETQWDAFADQFTYLNRLVVNAVTDAVAANPDAVIVVFSDHGTAPPGGDDADALKTITAVRMPGYVDEIPSDISVVDLLPEVLNTVLDTELPLQPYRGWISASEFPLTMTPVNE
jgi:hypothetical protein